jgi:hypothetical protein
MRNWSADTSALLSTNSRSVKLPSVFHRINFGALSYKEGVNLIADLLKAFVEKEVMMGDDLTAQDVQAEITAQLTKIADGSTALPQGLTFRNEGSGSSALVSNSDRGSSFDGFGSGRYEDRGGGSGRDYGGGFGGGRYEDRGGGSGRDSGGGFGGGRYEDRGGGSGRDSGGFGGGRYEDRGEDDDFVSSPQGKSSGRGKGNHAHAVKSQPTTEGAGCGGRKRGGGGGGGGSNDDDDDDDDEDED